MTKARFDIEGEISIESVELAINALRDANENDEVLIHLPFNNGGLTYAASELIEAVNQSKAQVIIEADRYVISAAAFIFVWFIVYPEEHVTVRTSEDPAPAVLVYHRPRICLEDGRLQFSSDLVEGDEGCEELCEVTKKFDDVFERFVKLCGFNPELNDDTERFKLGINHNRDAYYYNYDFVITL